MTSPRLFSKQSYQGCDIDLFHKYLTFFIDFWPHVTFCDLETTMGSDLYLSEPPTCGSFPHYRKVQVTPHCTFFRKTDGKGIIFVYILARLHEVWNLTQNDSKFNPKRDFEKKWFARFRVAFWLVSVTCFEFMTLERKKCCESVKIAVCPTAW